MARRGARRRWFSGAGLTLLAATGCAAPATFVGRVDGIELSFVQRFMATDWRHVFWNPDGTLDELDFLESDIRDDDLREIAGFPKLRILKLGRTKITDAGLAHLHDLPGLRVLGLRGTAVTGPGLGHLGRLPALNSLLLGSTAVGDEGLRLLRGHPALAELGLNETKVTDEGLVHLAALPALTAVYLRGCAVSEQGLEALRQARPGLQIHTEEETPDGEAGTRQGQALPPED